MSLNDVHLGVNLAIFVFWTCWKYEDRVFFIMTSTDQKVKETNW